MMMERYRVLPESVLKIVAVLSMAIDHVGAAIFLPYCTYLFQTNAPQADTVYHIYWVIRDIGRLAFPLYCFLLTEGFFHTGNRLKYARNLFAFALLSEIPFDLALYGKPFYWEGQNVYWTLLFALLGMIVMQKVWETKWQTAGKVVVMGTVAAGFMALGYVCQTDYDAWGVAAALAMYVLYRFRLIGFAAGVLILFWMAEVEAYAFLALPLVFLYNGERGRQRKWFYYAFYPVHFLILYAVFQVFKNHMMR